MKYHKKDWFKLAPNDVVLLGDLFVYCDGFESGEQDHFVHAEDAHFGKTADNWRYSAWAPYRRKRSNGKDIIRRLVSSRSNVKPLPLP
jgi:hypothetical protein